MSKNYLIIGGIGYIGSNIIKFIRFKESNAKIIAIDNRKYYSKNFTQSTAYEFIYGDMANENLMLKIMYDNEIDTVIVASQWIETECKKQTDLFHQALSSLTHLLEATRQYEKIQRFIYISSEQVYGLNPKKEDVVPKPVNFIGARYCACEAMLNSYIVSYRVPAIIVRLADVIYNEMDDYHMCFTDILEGIVNNSSAERLNILAMSDALCGINECLRNGKIGQIYNIGGTSDCDPKALLNILRMKQYDEKKFNKALFQPASLISSKASKTLNWRAEHSIQQALKDNILEDKIKHEGKNFLKQTTYKILAYVNDASTKKVVEKVCNQKNVKVVFASAKSGTEPTSVIIDEITSVAPSHILYLINHHDVNPDESRHHKLRENVQNNLFLPWLLADYCQQSFIHYVHLSLANFYDDEHFCENSLNTEDENDGFSNYFAVMLFTERLMQEFEDDILFCRTGILVEYNESLKHLKLLNSTFIPDARIFVADASECLAMLIDLALNNRRGFIDIASPGQIDGTQILDICQMQESKMVYKLTNFDRNGVRLKQMMDLTCIERLYPNIRTGKEVINDILKNIDR